MKIRIAVLGCAMVSLAASGCVKTESKSKVEKDGSGSLSQTITIDREKVKQLLEMVKGMPGVPSGGDGSSAPADDAGILTVDDLKAMVGAVEGLKIVKAEQVDAKDGKSSTISLEVAYADLSLLPKASLLPSTVLEKNADGTWTLTYDATFGEGGTAEDGKDAPSGLPAGFDPATLVAMLEPMMGDMSTMLTLTLPGPVVETNGTKGEGDTVSWKLGFKDLASNKAKMKVTFKGDGLSLQPFKAKADPTKMIERMGKRRAKPADAKPDAAKPGGAVPPPETPAPPAPPSDPK